MSDVLEKMGHQMPYGFPGMNIFLPANMTVLPVYNCITIKAVILFPLLEMAQGQ